MPELPEIETIKNSLLHSVNQKTIQMVDIRRNQLRYTIPNHLKKTLKKQKILDIKRIAKYLIIQLSKGQLIIHLGMSGSLTIKNKHQAFEKHEHFILYFDNFTLRLNDPRRFGCVLWSYKNITHPLLTKLGVEPLSQTFNEHYLFNKTKKTQQAIKLLIMNAKIVVGVGNIYALESLFLAKIMPNKQAHLLTQQQIKTLVQSIKKILKLAIQAGGTTIKDFKDINQKMGYFTQKLNVYKRDNKPCYHCQTIIVKFKQNNRSSFYCPSCQT